MVNNETLRLTSIKKAEYLCTPLLLRVGLISGTKLPALVPVPWETSLVIEYVNNFKKEAANLLENLVLQVLLLSTKTKIYLFDSSLDKEFSTLEKVSLKTKSIFVELFNDKRTQMRCLESLHKLARSRKTLLSQSDCIDWSDFLFKNKSSESFIICCIPDIECQITDNTYSLIMELLEHGSRVGIIFWMLSSKNKCIDFLSNSDQEKYIRNLKITKLLTWNIFSKPVHNKIILSFSTNAKQKNTISIFNELGVTQELINNKDLTVAVNNLEKRVMKLEENMQKDFLDVYIGDHQNRPFHFRMGSFSNTYHALISGQVRQGKSTLINRMLLSACEKYTPDEMLFFIFDYKGGLDYELFESVPHIPLIHSDVENYKMLLDILDVFQDENIRRSKIIKGNGRNIDEYNSIAKDNKEMEYLPRWILIVDEVQAFFDPKKNGIPEITAKEIEIKFAQTIVGLSRTAASQGLHFILATQTFRGVSMDAGAKGQFGLRISFKLGNEQDCRAIFGESNNAPLTLERYHGVYNDQNGDSTHNKIFNVNKLEDSELKTRLLKIRLMYPLKNKFFARFEEFKSNDSESVNSSKSPRDQNQRTRPWLNK